MLDLAMLNDGQRCSVMLSKATGERARLKKLTPWMHLSEVDECRAMTTG